LYYQFQILISQLNLPKQHDLLEVKIHSVSGREDFNSLLNLFFRIFPDEIDSEKGRELQAFPVAKIQGEGIYLARVDHKPVGFLLTGIINRVSYISYLGVLLEYRSRGVATALLKRFVDYLHANRIEKIRCKVRKDNTKTLEYIKYLGFNKL